MINKPYPCLWFDHQAKEAADYYCAIFPHSKILSSNPMATKFELDGTIFMGLNGGTDHRFNPAVSFVVECETQEEIDHYWDKLSKDGIESKCGWVYDRYGVSWQIVPKILGKLMGDPQTAPKVMYAFMQMKKFNIQKLLEAAK